MLSRRALLAGVGAASAGLAGCNRVFGDDESPTRLVPGDWTPDPGEWAGPGYDQANSSHNPHASPPSTEPTVDWADDRGRGSILIADGTVYHRETATLRGLDVTDGTEQFAVSRLSGSLYRYVDGRLYDETIDGIEALNLEGDSEWDDRIDYEDHVVGLVERDGYVYLSTGTDAIHHHEADTGERVDATVHDGRVGDLANRDGVLYAAVADGLVAYDVTDGGSLEEQWRGRLGAEETVDPITVSVGGALAYVLHRQRRGADVGYAVSLFDVDRAEHVDTIDFDRSPAVSAIGEYAYVATTPDDGRIPTEGEITAYDGTDELWSVEFEPGPVWSVLAGGTLFVGTGAEEPAITALDAGNGDELWTYAGAFPRAVVGETVYATTDDDRFVALRA